MTGPCAIASANSSSSGSFSIFSKNQVICPTQYKWHGDYMHCNHHFEICQTGTHCYLVCPCTSDEVDRWVRHKVRNSRKDH